VTVATLGVLLFGALVGGGIFWSLHRFGSKSSCPAPVPGTTVAATTTSGPELDGSGWVLIGDATDMRASAEPSAYYGHLGERCEYWIVLDHGVLAAYKGRLPGSSCAVKWKQPLHSFVCNQTKVEIPLAQLPRWPARLITSGPNKNSFEVNFS